MQGFKISIRLNVWYQKSGNRIYEERAAEEPDMECVTCSAYGTIIWNVKIIKLQLRQEKIVQYGTQEIRNKVF